MPHKKKSPLISNHITNYFRCLPKTNTFDESLEPYNGSDDDCIIYEPIEKKRKEDNDINYDYVDSEIQVLEIVGCFDKSDVQQTIDDLIDSADAIIKTETLNERCCDGDNRQFVDDCKTDHFSPNTSTNIDLINDTQLTFDLIEDCYATNAHINVLMTKKELEDVCKSLQLTPVLSFDYRIAKERNKASSKEVVYEVECIYDASAEERTNKVIYSVKWKNWAEEYNSWEPLSHLSNCVDLIDEFKVTERSDIPNISQIYRNFHRLKGIIEDLCDRKIDESTALTLLLKFNSVSVKEFQYTKAHKQRLRNQFKDRCDKILDKIANNRNAKTRVSMMANALNSLEQTLRITQTFQSLEQFFTFYEKRRNLQYKINKWEHNINQIIKNEKEGETIRVENYVDLEVPPSDFKYITKCKSFDDSITVCDDPPIYCECDDCEKKTGQCCVDIHENPIGYTKNGILRVNQGKAIYECNKKCKCSENCINRVIQKGRKHKLAIFRTDDDKGWGVRALEPILKGSFVMEYIGEIITVQEADKRGRIYDAEGRTYLFDLDYMPDDASDQHKYVVDATKYGNISHFVNHSCDPNLDSKVAWINNLDPFMPHIALFAVRHIKINEELTFDYKINVHGITENKDNCSVTEDSRDCTRSECVNGETVSNCSETGADSDDSGISLNNSSNTSTVKSLNNEIHLVRVKCRCGALKCRKYLY